MVWIRCDHHIVYSLRKNFDKISIKDCLAEYANSRLKFSDLAQSDLKKDS